MFSRLHDQIVANGAADWWRSPEGIETRQRIELDVRVRYRAELASASWFREILLQIRMRREIRAEMRKVMLEVLWVQE